jgi:hypothetical protein
MRHLSGRSVIICPLVRRPDGHEVKAKLLDSLEEPVQMCLVDDVTGQHRGARKPVHLHPLEQEAERLAELAAENQPVPSASCPVAVHTRARSHSGR